nr:MAG TPA: Insulin receptor [Caudoviricetes sp.]
MMLENLIIIIVMSVLSLAILFYCNKRMNETG